MATRKFRKSRARKTSRGKRTVRRHRVSTAGKILPPLDVRSKKHLSEFERRIKKGPLTIIMVWAPWCPHCHTMMPHFDAASKSPNRSIQSVKVEEKMLPAVNQIMARNINKSVAPLNVEGYPSIIVVDKQGNAVTNVEPVRDTESMTSLMAEAGPIAESAGLNGINKNMSASNVKNSVIKNSLKNIAKNVTNVTNANNAANAMAMTVNKGNNKRNLLANIGVENEGLVSGANSIRNSDVGEDELLGSIASKNANNKSIKLNSIPANKLANAGVNETKSVKESLKNATAPSPLNTFADENSKKSALSGNMNKEAEAVTSLASPLLPPSVASDMEDTESISNSLTAEQKVSGGGYSKGGSLYSAMAQTTYTLAPAAALLATAALVMKGKKRGNKTRKHSKKSRKTHKRR